MSTDVGMDEAKPIALDSPDAQARYSEMFRYAQAGRCVSGVVHDINNYLGAIMAYAELIDFDEGLSEESRRMLREIGTGVSKCSEMLNALTTVAREDRPNVSLVEAANLVERAASLRQYTLRSRQIQLETKIEPNTPSMVVDLPKMQMALVCLLFNAQEYLEQECAGGSERVIRVSVAHTSEQILFSVWNSGAPVPEAQREQIFLPFTTSQRQAHLGLGLPLVRATAELHRGSLSYDPADGFVLAISRDTGLAI